MMNLLVMLVIKILLLMEPRCTSLFVNVQACISVYVCVCVCVCVCVLSIFVCMFIKSYSSTF